MKRIHYVILLILMIAFVLLPLPSSDLLIKIQFSEVSDDSFELYYALDNPNNFTSDQYISSSVDFKNKEAVFRLDKSYSKRLSGLRIDLPNTSSLIGITNITVSSAGVIKKQYNPCDFFSEENVIYTNNIDSLTLATAKNTTYITTSGNDPFIILGDNLVSSIRNAYSNYRLTRLFICLFILGTCFMKEIHIFKPD